MAVLEEARGLPRDDAPRHRPLMDEQPARLSLTSSERMGHWAQATNWPLSESGRWESVPPGDDYEVVFTEDRLGLTLRCQAPDEAGGSAPSPTIVKSTSDTEQRVKEGDILISVNDQSVVELDFRDVRRLLKVSSRPIRLRFRSACPQYTGSENDDGRSDVAFSDIATASGSVSSESSSDVDDSGAGDASDLSAFALPAPSSERGNDEVHEHDDDDVESRQAVQSESFGDADSTRTTENSSVLADLSDFDYKFARHSLFSTFLRKPFRRMEGTDNRWIDTRLGAVPVLPRVEVALESPSKAALRVHWVQFPTSISSHVQFARDRAMKVWRNWPGRVRRSLGNDRELTTTIFGLDFGKSYVVRIRFVFNGAPFLLSEWSAPSSPVVTTVPGRSQSLRSEFLRVTPRV